MEWNWWVLLVALPAWLLQNIIHEGSHALTARVKYHIRLKAFYPLPAWFSPLGEHQWWKPWAPTKKPWPDARFVFAGVVWEKAVPHKKYSFVLFAPNLGALIISVLALSWMLQVDAYWRILFLPFMIAPAIDMIVWWSGVFRNKTTTDGYKWRHGPAQVVEDDPPDVVVEADPPE